MWHQVWIIISLSSFGDSAEFSCRLSICDLLGLNHMQSIDNTVKHSRWWLHSDTDCEIDRAYFKNMTIMTVRTFQSQPIRQKRKYAWETVDSARWSTNLVDYCAAGVMRLSDSVSMVLDITWNSFQRKTWLFMAFTSNFMEFSTLLSKHENSSAFVFCTNPQRWVSGKSQTFYSRSGRGCRKSDPSPPLGRNARGGNETGYTYITQCRNLIWRHVLTTMCLRAHRHVS